MNKKYIVYFDNGRDEIPRIIGTANSQDKVWKVIIAFLNEHNYTAPYVREWEENNKHWYDVGSHTEFFFSEGVEY